MYGLHLTHKGESLAQLVVDGLDLLFRHGGCFHGIDSSVEVEVKCRCWPAIIVSP